MAKSISFKVGRDGELSISNNEALWEDQLEDRQSGGDGDIVAHIDYKVDDDSRKTALDVLWGCHELEIRGHSTVLSTLEMMARAIWEEGVQYGRRHP